ncbi:MAG: hypothetical protein OEM91_10905, partial [Hyphomicrobiales bacterium]|nr:hypothetical protein [Hyphomicrobiales bacterium]
MVVGATRDDQNLMIRCDSSAVIERPRKRFSIESGVRTHARTKGSCEKEEWGLADEGQKGQEQETR